MTEHLLRGLSAEQPDGRWRLWGAVPPDLRWPGAEVVPARHDPHDWYGQRALLAQPRADRAIWCHQYRPLRRSAPVEIGLIYDTIPLRWGRTGLVGRAQRLYLRRVAAITDRVIAISEFAKGTLITDLGIAADHIDVVALPVDADSIGRVTQARSRTTSRSHVVFVGRFAPHKNLGRLMEAFPATAFAASGGHLVLVGGTPDEVEALAARAGPSIDVRTRCSQDELEALLATAAALVQPSLEEGYGLPLVEALDAGIPAAAANTGAMPEVAGGRAVLFDPLDLQAITRAVDEAVAMERAPISDAEAVRPEQFARSVLRTLDRATPSSSLRSHHAA